MLLDETGDVPLPLLGEDVAEVLGHLHRRPGLQRPAAHSGADQFRFGTIDEPHRNCQGGY